MRFWDASAIVPLQVEEVTTAEVQALLQEDPLVAVWWGARVESTSALMRLVRESRMSREEIGQIREFFKEYFEEADEVGPTTEVRDLAEDLLARHALRAADALQLSAAVIWSRTVTASAEFVCLDNRLREAARNEGFGVLPPINVSLSLR
ncbi:MAG: type II toxin-antitoxin system VapC family toxin [Dehalococcoidia bacterium]